MRSAGDALAEAKRLRAQGFAVHWLHPKSKRPIGKDWADKPVLSVKGLEHAHEPGYNVGVRLGVPSKIGDHHLHVIDMDVRVDDAAPEARRVLKRMFPDVDLYPTVISGSGGASRHFYLLTDRPFRSKKLAHSGVKFKDEDGRSHWTWEIELFGTGKQVVLPPSIHPDTGEPYRWQRPFDFDMLDLGEGPFVPASALAALGTSADNDDDEEEDQSLDDLVANRPLGLTFDQAWAVLSKLPVDDYCDDRDGWLKVGMALHHEFAGGSEGFKLWCRFSKQSEKFDPDDQRRVWESFTRKKNPVRMASLVAVAKRITDEEAEDAEDEAEEVEAAGDGEDGDDWRKIEREWMKLLDRTEEGAIRPTLHNVMLLVRHDARTKGLPQFNLFTQSVVKRTKPGIKRILKAKKPVTQLDGVIWKVEDPVNGDAWNDSMDNAVRGAFEAPERQGGYGIKISDRDLKAAVDAVAQENAFHPVREYLTGLKWDGKKRLETCFHRYLGCGDTAYTRSVSKLVFLGAATRAFEPGHKFDFVAIFEGLQGKGKSTFISIMARHWFAELSSRAFENPKEMVESTLGSWILEIPELSGFKRSEVNDIKAALSATTSKVRLSYERRARIYYRCNIYLGSTNDSAYLRDETGNRRFWPVRCTVTEIDTKAFRREIDQLWAEAVAEYRRMRKAQPKGELPLYLTGQDAREEAMAAQMDRKVETPTDLMRQRIQEWLDRPVLRSRIWAAPSAADAFDDLEGEEMVLRDVTCARQVIEHIAGKAVEDVPQGLQYTIVNALGHLPGWHREPKRRTPMGQVPVYVRSDTTYEEARNHGWGRPKNEIVDLFDDIV